MNIRVYSVFQLIRINRLFLFFPLQKIKLICLIFNIPASMKFKLMWENWYKVLPTVVGRLVLDFWQKKR